MTSMTTKDTAMSAIERVEDDAPEQRVKRQEEIWRVADIVKDATILTPNGPRSVGYYVGVALDVLRPDDNPFQAIINAAAEAVVADRAAPTLARQSDAALSDDRVEAAFKDGFVLGFDHRGRTDDPLEAINGAERDWQHRVFRAALTPPSGNSLENRDG